MRKILLLTCGVVIGASATLFTTSSLVRVSSAQAQATADVYKALNLFGDVFERVREEYVEQPNDEALIESAINGMLTSLDPHSSYLNAKSFRDIQIQTSGEFGGLGIEVTMEDGLVKVVTPIDDTPAARAGIQPGDLITHLDDKAVQGLSLQQAVEIMRGAPKTPITLKILRGEAKNEMDITIVRDVIQIRAVKHRIEGDVGYIRISSFSSQTYQNLVSAIEDIEKKVGSDLKGYVIDLRNNPGGLLDQAVYVSDAFLERGEVVSTRGRDPKDIQRRMSKPGDDANHMPVVVLVNGASASASEIVAGALQDHKRATIVGTRTFGKGSVQSIIPIGQEGAIRITTARYYTPSGRSIQAKGVDPDIIIEQDIPDELKGKDSTKGEVSLEGHLEGENEKDNETGGSSAYVPQDPKEDKQLNYAMDLLRGKVTHAAFPYHVEVGAPSSEDPQAGHAKVM